MLHPAKNYLTKDLQTKEIIAETKGNCQFSTFPFIFNYFLALKKIYEIFIF